MRARYVAAEVRNCALLQQRQTPGMQPPPFHRSYRHIELPVATVATNAAFALVPAVVLIALAKPIAVAHARLVTSLVGWAGVAVTERSVAFGNGELPVPLLVNPLPPDPLSAAVLAIGGAIIAGVALLMTSRITPGRVLTGVVALICSTSGFFFWVKPGAFPYTSADFSAAWCRAEFIIWLVIPFLYAVILSPLPLKAGETLLYTSQAMLYAMWFSAVRLTLFFIVFDLAGLLLMAPAFFVFGFLLDFLFIVAYYSLAVARASRRLKTRREVWRW